MGGRVKLRVATGSLARRMSVLKSAGHTDINLIELPEPMTRAVAAVYIQREFAGVSLFKPKVSAPESVSQTEELQVEFTPESVDA